MPSVSSTVERVTRFALNVTVAPGSGAEAVYRRSVAVAAAIPAVAEIAIAVTAGAVAGGQAPSPADDLHYKGGKILPDLTFTNFFVGGQDAWQASDVANIDRALAAAMSDRKLNNVLVQYFFGQGVTSSFQPSRFLPGPKPQVVSRGDVEQTVGHVHEQGLLAGFDLGTTVFNFMLPSGTILTADDAPSGAITGAAQAGGSVAGDGGDGQGQGVVADADEETKADSRVGLGGYHGSVQVGADTVYYAVGVFSEVLPDGTSNGIPVFPEPWKNVVATFYHELSEARTDPDVEQANRTGDGSLIGWVSNAGDEIGDFALKGGFAPRDVITEVPLADGSGTVPVQFEFSDFVHGPEGPADQPRPPV